jgi:hypothetical protein
LADRIAITLADRIHPDSAEAVRDVRDR